METTTARTTHITDNPTGSSSMKRVDNGAASNLIPTVEKHDEDEDAQNASETSAIRIPKKAEGASQVSNDASGLLTKQEYSHAERFTVPDNALELLIDTPYRPTVQNNDVVEYVEDVWLTPSAPPCDDDKRSNVHDLPREDDARLTPTAPTTDGDEGSNEHDLPREDDARLTPTAPTPDGDEGSIEHELRRDDDARLTPTAPPRGDEERSIGHALPPESVQAICRHLISMTEDENWISQLMLKGLTEHELDIIRWLNPQLRRHYKDMVYKENIFRDLEKYPPGFYFVSDKNQKGENEMLHLTAIVVVPPGGKPRYFDSHGNVPDELRGRVEWSRLKPQKNVNTCAFHCLYVFDMWTKFSTVDPNLPTFSQQTFKEFIDALYSPTEKQDWTPNDDASADNVSVKRSCSFENGDCNPNFDPDINVMFYFKNNLLPALRKCINDAHSD